MTLILEQRPTSPKTDRRRSARHSLCLDAKVAVPDHADLPGTVHELSRSGFLLECKGPLGVGEEFGIALPDYPALKARTVWACGSLLGCEFRQPLSASACSQLLLKARPAKLSQSPDWRVDEVEPRAAASAQSASRRKLAIFAGTSIALWAAIAATAALLI